MVKPVALVRLFTTWRTGSPRGVRLPGLISNALTTLLMPGIPSACSVRIRPTSLGPWCRGFRGSLRVRRCSQAPWPSPERHPRTGGCAPGTQRCSCSASALSRRTGRKRAWSRHGHHTSLVTPSHPAIDCCDDLLDAGLQALGHRLLSGIVSIPDLLLREPHPEIHSQATGLAI